MENYIHSAVLRRPPIRFHFDDDLRDRRLALVSIGVYSVSPTPPRGERTNRHSHGARATRSDAVKLVLAWVSRHWHRDRHRLVASLALSRILASRLADIDPLSTDDLRRGDFAFRHWRRGVRYPARRATSIEPTLPCVTSSTKEHRHASLDENISRSRPRSR